MRKLVSLGAVLLFIFGIAFLARPAAGLIPCDCEYCAGSPGGWCSDQEDGGARMLCYQYNSFYCSGLTAPPILGKEASGAAFFAAQLSGVSRSDGRTCASEPIATPGSW